MKNEVFVAVRRILRMPDRRCIVADLSSTGCRQVVRCTDMSRTRHPQICWNSRSYFKFLFILDTPHNFSALYRPRSSREWLNSFPVPIPKPGKNHRELKGHRIIAAQIFFCKLAENVVTGLLTKQLEESLSNTLGAYRLGRATWTNAGFATSVIFEAFEARESALAVGLDIDDAYNAVRLPRLVNDLLHLGVNPYLDRWRAGHQVPSLLYEMRQMVFSVGGSGDGLTAGLNLNLTSLSQRLH